jgi:hypothetical protein
MRWLGGSSFTYIMSHLIIRVVFRHQVHTVPAAQMSRKMENHGLVESSRRILLLLLHGSSSVTTESGVHKVGGQDFSNRLQQPRKAPAANNYVSIASGSPI